MRDWTWTSRDYPGRASLVLRRSGQRAEADQLVAALRESPGAAILEGAVNRDRTSSLEMLVSLARRLGDLLPQGPRRDSVHVIEVGSAGTSEQWFPSDRRHFDLHTDAAYMASPPEILVMACFESAADGGATLLLSAAHVEAALRSAGEDVHSRSKLPFEFSSWLEDEPTDLPEAKSHSGPILMTNDRQGPRVRFHASRIERGQSIKFGGLGTLEKRTLEVVKSAGRSPGLMARVRLQRGDVLVVNNTRLLHGRESFRDSDQGPNRSIARLWVRSESL